MTKQIQGACVRVIVCPYEIAAFMKLWPCSGLDSEIGFDFIFESRSGDLVDIQARNQEGRTVASAADFDGAALAALADDARAAAFA